MTEWPWWAGALGLGTVALGHYLLLGKQLAVSGAFLKIVRLRAEREAERALGTDTAARDRALEAETLRMLAAHPELSWAMAEDLPAPAEPSAAVPVDAVGPTPWTAHLSLLLGVVAGGAVAQLLRDGGAGAPPAAVESSLVALWGQGWSAAGVLLAGGVMVGLGACLAGGCTSGNGLSGCSRLQPGSLVATACFMAAGIALSLLARGSP